MIRFLNQDRKLNEALESLLSLEKQTRTAADMHSTARILVAIVKLCFQAKDWEALNEHIVLLTKRRSQLKKYTEKTADMTSYRRRHLLFFYRKVLANAMNGRWR